MQKSDNLLLNLLTKIFLPCIANEFLHGFGFVECDGAHQAVFAWGCLLAHQVSVVMGVLMTVFFLGYTRVQLNTKPIKGGHALYVPFC